MARNEEEVKKLEAAAKNRIKDIQEWAERGFPNFDGKIKGMNIKGFPCQVEPGQFLNDPDRVEKYGVRFRLFWLEKDGSYFSDLDIRIQPERSMKKDVPKEIYQGPMIVIYVNEGDCLRWKELVSENIDEKKSVQEFFARWLKYACEKSNYQTKIYSYRRHG